MVPPYWFGREETDHCHYLIDQYARELQLNQGRSANSRVPLEFVGRVKRTLSLEDIGRRNTDDHISTLDVAQIHFLEAIPFGSEFKKIRDVYLHTSWSSLDGVPLAIEEVSQADYNRVVSQIPSFLQTQSSLYHLPLINDAHAEFFPAEERLPVVHGGLEGLMLYRLFHRRRSWDGRQSERSSGDDSLHVGRDGEEEEDDDDGFCDAVETTAGPIPGGDEEDDDDDDDHDDDDGGEDYSFLENGVATDDGRMPFESDSDDGDAEGEEGEEDVKKEGEEEEEEEEELEDEDGEFRPLTVHESMEGKYESDEDESEGMASALWRAFGF